MAAIVRQRQAVSTRGARRGVASVLAMLYLVIFSTLALGFFASTTLSTQIAGNDRRTWFAIARGLRCKRFVEGIHAEEHCERQHNQHKEDN